MTAEALLDVKDMSVSITTRSGHLEALRNVSFSVGRGETLCLVGESGCGKSITALSLLGLLPRNATRRAERISLSDADLLGLSEAQLKEFRGPRMAIIFQEPMTSLNPTFTVGYQIVDVLRQHQKISKSEARKKAIELLERVGVTAASDRMAQYPHQLSGGLRQRIVIAMALICRPELLLADEPTTALDVTIQADLLRLLKSLQDDFAMGMIFITHDIAIVSRIADRVGLMYAGQIIEYGTVSDVLNRPQHPYTQGLLACLPGSSTPHGGNLPSIPGTLPSLINPPTGCSFRARCPQARPDCSGSIPIQEASPGHTYRCVLPVREKVTSDA